MAALEIVRLHLTHFLLPERLCPCDFPCQTRRAQPAFERGCV